MAHATSQAGFVAARERRLHEALQQLSEAVQFGAGDPSIHKAVGLCALALGHVERARSAWERCPNDPQAQEWLSSLGSGEIREALQSYNAAVAASHSDRLQNAAAAVHRTLELLPGFIPAYRLSGLLHVAAADLPAARAVWEEGVRYCGDDTELLRLMAAQTMPLRNGRDRPAQRRGVAVAALWLLTLIGAAAVGAILDQGETESSASTAATDFTDSRVQSAAPQRPQTTPGPTGDALTVVDYRLGRLAFDAEHWDAVQYHLSAAVSSPAQQQYFHDDALYLLAMAYANMGDRNAAAEVARQILEQHPSSIFANSVTRSLASTGAQ